MADGKTYTGGCHCGGYASRPPPIPPRPSLATAPTVQTWALAHVRQPTQFKLPEGLDAVGDYRFNKHVIHHVFCRTCGVEPFARGRQQDGTDMFAVNVRCLDEIDIARLTPRPFEGKHL